jgi:hypothetical protein
MNDVFYENEREMNLILFKRLKADDSEVKSKQLNFHALSKFNSFTYYSCRDVILMSEREKKFSRIETTLTLSRVQFHFQFFFE